jgi:hypothetical protein
MPFKLNREDVAGQTMNMVSKGPGSRFGRARGLSGVHITLVHLPTKVTVTGEIPLGHFARKQLSGLRDELYEWLILDLEKKVAKVLRVPGR